MIKLVIKISDKISELYFIRDVRLSSQEGAIVETVEYWKINEKNKNLK